MTVSIAFALIGGVILLGFLANLLFRVTKIPSVLLLISIGVLLGPVTGLVSSNLLIAIAPFFGTLALLIILFEGGLELDIASVIKQAPTATVLALLAFLLTVVSVAVFAFSVLHLSLLNSLLLAAILGANSPAICLPVVSGLSTRKEIKTILKLESALGDVLLIVCVLLLMDVQTSGKQSLPGIALALFLSITVAFVVSVVAGVLLSRLIGWMGKEPLAYMLTLGFVFLLYFGVEELHGSAALAILMFGMVLENMHTVADRIGVRLLFFFGINIRAEQFVLQEFMKNITAELSFLIRTFFFVYLGLLLDFGTLKLKTALYGLAIVFLLLASRWLATRLAVRRSLFSSGELKAILFMLPRGLTTAVMAFLPMQQNIAGTEQFPVYAFMSIVLTNLLMTGGIYIAERQLSKKKEERPLLAEEAVEDALPESAAASAAKSEIAAPPMESQISEQGAAAPARRSEGSSALPGEGAGMEPVSFTNQMLRLFGIRPEEREQRYFQAIRASALAPPLFWVQIFFASVLTALGLVLDQGSIIIGAALIVPIAWPVLASGLALAVGDIYLLLKLLLKLLLVAAMIALLSAFFSELLPFNAVTAEISSRTKPTILDFLVALFAGMSGAALLFSRRRLLHYFPGAILGLTLVPPLVVLGFGFGSEFSAEIFQGAALLFTANFFAAILGASLVYILVGMPQAAALASIRAWKQQELSQPLVQFMFDRMKLGGIVGRAGSTHSRLLVVIIFLLALVIPLQMAFNQLSLEFRARQAIADLQKMFDAPGRSAIINSSSNIGKADIYVRIQIATNDFFTASDIRQFEQRVSDRTGRRTRLDLVQSLSDIGEGTKIRGMLARTTPDSVDYKPDINAIVALLRNEIDTSLRAAAFPDSIHILRVSADLALNGKTSAFRIEYLAESPLSEDATELLANLVKRQMGLLGGEVRFHCIPSRYEFDIKARMSRVANRGSWIQDIQAILHQFPHLQATIELPARLSEKQADEIRITLGRAAPLLGDPARTGIRRNSELKDRAVVLLHPGTAFASQ
jgi:cell volume regulation protein A